MKSLFKMELLALAIAIVMGLTLVSCNKGGVIFDTHLKFNKCEARFPDGSIRILKVRKWYDYQNSDQIQIETTDGCVYVFHANNVVLINDENKDGGYDGKE